MLTLNARPATRTGYGHGHGHRHAALTGVPGPQNAYVADTQNVRPGAVMPLVHASVR